MGQIRNAAVYVLFHCILKDIYSGSRIPIFSNLDPGSASKNFSILTQKIVSQLRKYDPGCSSCIRILIFYPSRIQGVKKAPDPGSGSATLGDWYLIMCGRRMNRACAEQTLQLGHTLVTCHLKNGNLQKQLFFTVPFKLLQSLNRRTLIIKLSFGRCAQNGSEKWNLTIQIKHGKKI